MIPFATSRSWSSTRISASTSADTELTICVTHDELSTFVNICRTARFTILRTLMSMSVKQTPRMKLGHGLPSKYVKLTFILNVNSMSTQSSAASVCKCRLGRKGRRRRRPPEMREKAAAKTALTEVVTSAGTSDNFSFTTTSGSPSVIFASCSIAKSAASSSDVVQLSVSVSFARLPAAMATSHPETLRAAS